MLTLFRVTEICIKEKYITFYIIYVLMVVTWYEFVNFLVKGIHERGIQLNVLQITYGPKNQGQANQLL